MPGRQEAGLARQRSVMDDQTYPIHRGEAGTLALPVTELMLHFDGDALSDESLVLLYGQSFAALSRHLTHFRVDPMIHARASPEFGASVAEDWVADAIDDRRALHVELTSGASPDTVGPWSMRWHVPGQWQRKGVAALRLTWPVEFGLRRPAELERVFRGLSAALPDAWGSAGFAIEYDIRRVAPERDRTMRAWCGRYRGLVHRDFDEVMNSDVPSFTSASWLNLLPASWNEVPAQSGPETMERLVKVSAEPTLGDRNRDEDVHGLAQLQSWLRDWLTVPEQLPGGMDEEAFLIWRDRFDSRS